MAVCRDSTVIDSGSEHAEEEPDGDDDEPEDEDEDADTSESGTPRIRGETGWRWRMNARPRTSIGDGAVEVARVCRWWTVHLTRSLSRRLDENVEADLVEDALSASAARTSRELQIPIPTRIQDEGGLACLVYLILRIDGSLAIEDMLIADE